MKDQHATSTEPSQENANRRRKIRARQIPTADFSRPWEPPNNGSSSEDDSATYDETGGG